MRPDVDRRAWMAAVAACALARPVQARRFPERAVRLVVPYGAGVGPDVVARIVGERLSGHWRQPVVVDNKPGASGIIAFSEVRRTPPDGYTLFLADTATLCVNPLIHGALPYDPAADLVPLTLLFRATFVILTGGEGRFSGVAPMLEAARRTPGSVRYASLGHGHASHVAVETLARAAGVQLLHVPFKDAGALFAAVSSGQVDFTAFSLNTVAGLVARGRLRPLAVAARARLSQAPELPTLAESGAPDVEMRPWAGLVAVAGTPAALLSQLQSDVVAAIDAPQVRERLEPLGFELTPSGPAEFRRQVADDLAQYAPLVREGRVSRL